MVKPLREQLREDTLTCVPKRGMPEVMAQRNGLGEILVQTQGARHSPGNLAREKIQVAYPRLNPFLVQKTVGREFRPPKSLCKL